MQVEYNNTAYKNYTNMVNLLEQRIEAMKLKKCEGCKHKPNDGECYYEPCGTCARFFYDHYEPKATT